MTRLLLQIPSLISVTLFCAFVIGFAEKVAG